MNRKRLLALHTRMYVKYANPKVFARCLHLYLKLRESTLLCCPKTRGLQATLSPQKAVDTPPTNFALICQYLPKDSISALVAQILWLANRNSCFFFLRSRSQLRI